MLSMRAKAASGFTMIELIVTLSIFAFLVALAVPTMKDWIANAKVRTVADALQNGMRMAQSESLRRSRQVVFALTNSTNPQGDFTGGTLTAAANGGSWVIVTIPAMVDGSESAAFVGSGVITSAGSTVAVTGPAAVCFNSVGRLVTNASTGVTSGNCTNTATGTPPKYQYVVQLTGGRQMYVQLALGGQVHLCDPTQTLSSTNPYGC
jgi:type IV fimbrial biogenesis protein FimT